MGEWFRESKDEQAAFREFLEILEHTNFFKRADEAARKDLIEIFLRVFERDYKYCRELFNDLVSSFSERGAIVGRSLYLQREALLHVLHFFEKVITNIRDSLSAKDDVGKAEHLGITLANFLSAVDYGLSSVIYSDYNRRQLEKELENTKDRLLEYARQIRRELDSMGESMNHKPIRKRIEKIAGGSCETIRQLLNEIAAIFAS